MTEISQTKNWTDGLYLESLTDYPEASLSAFYFQNAQFIQNDMGGAQ